MSHKEIWLLSGLVSISRNQKLMVREGSYICIFYVDAVAYHFFPLFVLKASVDRVSSVSWVNRIFLSFSLFNICLE